MALCKYCNPIVFCDLGSQSISLVLVAIQHACMHELDLMCSLLEWAQCDTAVLLLLVLLQNTFLCC